MKNTIKSTPTPTLTQDYPYIAKGTILTLNSTDKPAIVMFGGTSNSILVKINKHNTYITRDEIKG